MFLKLSAFYFFYFAAVGVYVIFMPKALNDIGYSASQIGVIFAVAPLMRFLTPFVFLKHIHLTKTIFISSLALSVISSWMFFFTVNNFWLFLINNIFIGITLSLVLPYIETFALKSLGDRYGKSRLWGSIGFMIISLVLAQMIASTDITLYYYLGTTVFTALFAILLLKYDNQKHTKNSIDNSDFSMIKHWGFWLSLFLMQVSFGGFYTFFTIYESDMGISRDMIGYLWAFGVLCEIVMFYFQGPLIKKNLLTIIKISIALTAFRWWLLFMYGDNLTITFISQSIHAFSFGLYHTAVIMYLYTLYNNKKLAQQFMFGVAYGLGGMIGSIIASWFYGEYLFLSSAFIALLAYLSLSNSNDIDK
jgi:PPP family 3-phenylpropionic acid transporter